MYPAYPHHTKEMIPSHTKIDPSSPTQLYQPWHYGGSYLYPVPHQYHGCCNHSCYGGGPYGFWPPYTHYPPAPAYFHPHGMYAPYPGVYPAAYSVPPQHYSVEQPRYEYDKNDHAPHHCCGCNHREDEKSSKIKEVPQVVDKDGSESLAPLLLKDRPEYPIVWVPRDYMSNSESKAKEKEKEKYNRDLEPVIRGGNGEMAHDEQSGGGGNRFPFKIFWLPSKNDEMGKDTKENNLDQVAKKGLSDENMTTKNEAFDSDGERETNSKHAIQKAVPMKQVSTNKEEPGTKHAVQKVVPVKQASTNEEEASSKHTVQKVIPVKQVSANEEKNSKSAEAIVNSDSVEKTNNGSKASPKTPKLPPVCLRIDPLPRKKKSSRSPSPGEKGRSNASLVDSPKSSRQQAQVLKKSKEEQDEGHIKTVNQVELDNLADHGDVPRGKEDEIEKRKVDEKKNLSKEEQDEGHVKTVEHALNEVELDNLVDHGDVPQVKGDENEKRKVEEKKNLSEHEAALIIQSVYRGFEVRKSQPLKKLRQIYEVKKQVFELRDRIQDMESSSSTMNIDDKKKMIIGETIMSLLLKLDTIQGLHPFVREVRKSVAKELVGLQEKLDSLPSAKSETPSEGRPQEVMHPEGDAIKEKSDQAQAHTGLCENHVQIATETQYDDDAEACNTSNPEQQSEKSAEDDAIMDKSHQTPTKSDTVICQNEEVQDIESQQGSNTIGDLQLGLEKEKLDQVPTECDEAPGLCESQEMEATESQEDGNTRELQLGFHEEKLDQAPTERDEAPGLCENCEAGSIESQEGCNSIGEPQLDSDKEKLDQAPSERDEALGSCENHEVATTESEEGFNTIEEPHLESHKEELDQAQTEAHKEELDQAPTEALELGKNHEAETMESQEGCNTVSEPHLESHKEELGHVLTEAHKEELDQAPNEALGLCENHEAEAMESQEGCNTVEFQKEELDHEPTEALRSCKNHEVESTESQEGYNATSEPQMESHDEKLDEAPTKCDEALGLCDNHMAKPIDSVDNGGLEARDMKVEHNSQEPNSNQLQMPLETDSVQGAGVETMAHDFDACQQRHEVAISESCNNSGTKTQDNNLVVSGNVHMDDGDMMKMKSELAEEDAAKEIQNAKAKDVEGSSGGLVEENEKLRVAVEELMKAGNEQLGVIRELTGRVKDLEKKLSKKKKIRVNNRCRRSRGCVVQKD